MLQYRIKLSGFQEIRPLLFKRLALMLPLLAGMAYWLSSTENSALPWWIMPALLGIMWVGSAVFQLKRQRVIFESYLLTLTPENLIRAQEHVPSIVLPLADITSITKNRNGSLTIRGRDLNHTIGVPA